MNLPEPAPPAMTAKQLISSGDIITASAGQSPAVSSLLIPRLFTEDARSESDCSITDECKSSNASHSNLAIKKGTAKDLRRKIIMDSLASLDGPDSSPSSTDSEDSGSDASSISLSGTAMMRVRGSHRPSDGPVPKGVPGQWSPALSHRTTLGSLAPGGHKKPALGSLDNNSFSDAYCASREQSEDESGSSGNNGSREFISSASSSSSSSLDLARHSGVSLVRKLTADKIRRRLNMSAASENSPETEYGSDDSSFDNVTIGSLSLQDKVKDSIDSLPLQLTERMVSSSLDNSSNDSISMTNRNSKRDQGSQDLTWSDNAKGGGAPTDLNNRLMMSSESSSLNHSTESITSRRFVSIAQKKNILSGSFASQQTEKPSKMTATDIIMKLAKDSSLDHIKNGDLDEVADKGARSSLPSKTKIGDLFPVLSKKERIASETPSESTEPGLEDLKKEFLNGPPTSRSALTKLERPLKSILKTASKPFIERKSSDGLHLLQESEERVTKVKWLQVYSSSNKKAQRIKKMDLV